MVQIHLESWIAAPVERVSDLARDIDFHQRSMAHTGERAIGGRTSGRIDAGETIHRIGSWTNRSRAHCVVSS